MARHTRRRAIRLAGSASVIGLAGCLGTLGEGGPAESTPDDESDDEPDDGSERSCDDYAYDGDSSDEEGEYPEDLFIRNVGFSAYSVEISISDVSGGTPEEVVSCLATSEAHSELVFDLDASTEYRVDAALLRDGRDSREETSIEVSGWDQVSGPNEALEVTVENGEFRIRHVHYDPPRETA